MPDVADLFPKLAELDFAALNSRRAAIIGSRTSFRELTLEELQELAAISTLLRRKAAGPPREAKKTKAASIKSVTDLMV